MSIWKKTGAEWTRADFGVHGIAFIVCQGPSLLKIDTTQLTGPGRLVIGVNNVYPAVRPDVWIGMDDADCYEQRLFWEKFPKILRGGYQKHPFVGATLGDVPAAYFADVDNGGDMWRYQRDGKFSWHNDTFRIAIQFALSIGCTAVHLIGVDLDTAEKDYADGVELSAEQRAYNQKLYNDQRSFLRDFSSKARWRNIHIGSCSPGSCINEFMDFSPLREVVAAIESRMLSGRPKRHVLATSGA